VVLTEAGRRLQALAREQLQGLQDFKHDCATERVQLSLAEGDSIIQWVLIPKLPGLLPQVAERSIAPAESVQRGDCKRVGRRNA
jgi:DNA-binding transcriptional LysR family regulator